MPKSNGTNGAASKPSDGPSISGNSGTRASHPQRQQRRLLNFNSPRTAWVLSLLLALTLVAQLALIVYHEQILTELTSLEAELLADAAAATSIANDVIGAANEYNADDVVVVGGAVSASSAGDNDKHRPVFARGGSGGGNERGGGGRGARGPKAVPLSRDHSTYSMEPIEILKRAGVDHTEGFIPSITVREARAASKTGNMDRHRRQVELPTLGEIQSMYGNRTHILGLERCEEYRDMVKPEHRIMGPAGIFNSATNLLNKLLKLNCANTARLKKGWKQKDGMLLQAPWGKHNPVTWRMHHEAAVGGKGFKQDDFLP